MQQFPDYSPAVFAFNWWWVVFGVTFFTLVFGLYYYLFHTKVEEQRWAAKGAARRQRKLDERMDVIHQGMQEAVGNARLAREDAEAAARRAEAARDGARALAEAEAAASAAQRAQDSATAASNTARALMKRRDRNIMDKKGRRAGTEADEDAAAARAAAERAAKVAAARGFPVTSANPAGN